MNCESYRIELEDFLYGEVSEKRSTEIRAHLASCKECDSLREKLERENEIFAEFYEQTSFEPSGEMWEAIRSRIQTEPAPRKAFVEEKRGGLIGIFGWLMRPAVLRQAAFAVVLIAATVGVTTYLVKRGDEPAENIAKNGEKVATTPSPDAAATPRPVRTPQTEIAIAGSGSIPIVGKAQTPRKAAKPLTEQEMLNQQIARAEREYQSAIRMLDTAIVKRKESLDPAVFKQYEGSLALINSSIAESKRALREKPSDLAAGQFLLAAYAKKVELMQDIAMR